MSKTYVAVVGKGRNCPESTWRLAAEAGALVGRLGESCVLVTGGLGGAMRAAADAAHERGGAVVGILPGAEHRSSEVYEHADLMINTGLSVHIRNIVLAATADVVIAVPGSHGTFQEMIIALDLEKPVLAIGEHPVRLPGVEYLGSTAELADRLTKIVDDADG
jgi:hypothetical protein